MRKLLNFVTSSLLALSLMLAPLSLALASDLSITAANVAPVAGSTTVSGLAGETVTAGQVVYRSSTTGKYLKADNNSATAEARKALGIALNGASDGQPLKVHTKGKITMGATMTAGVAYYLSATAGGICPVADLSTGMYPGFIGIAISTTVLEVNPTYSGVAL